MLELARWLHEASRLRRPLHGRRRRAELRDERPAPRPRPFRADLGPAGRRRRRHGPRRGALDRRPGARRGDDERAFRMDHAFLGPRLRDDEIEEFLRWSKLPYRRLDDVRRGDRRASWRQDQVIGWFQGRMEFGPRALGGRSILASPIHAEMQARLNEIKDREDFRPVAPVVLEEEAADWFVAPRLAVHAVRPRRAAREGRPHPGRPPRRRHGAHPDDQPRPATRSTTTCSRPSRRGPACRCWSTRRSTRAASRSSARRATRRVLLDLAARRPGDRLVPAREGRASVTIARLGRRADLRAARPARPLPRGAGRAGRSTRRALRDRDRRRRRRERARRGGRSSGWPRHRHRAPTLRYLPARRRDTARPRRGTPAGARRGPASSRSPTTTASPTRDWLASGARRVRPTARPPSPGRVDRAAARRADRLRARRRRPRAAPSSSRPTASSAATLLEAVGGFDERFAAAWREDSDLHFALRASGAPIVRRRTPRVVVHPVRPAPLGRQPRAAAQEPVRRAAVQEAPAALPPPASGLAALGLLRDRSRLGVGAAVDAVAGFDCSALIGLAVWAGLRRRLLRRDACGTSHRAPGHVAEMVVTSALIPPLSVFWRLYGALRFRVPFL